MEEENKKEQDQPREDVIKEIDNFFHLRKKKTHVDYLHSFSSWWGKRSNTFNNWLVQFFLNHMLDVRDDIGCLDILQPYVNKWSPWKLKHSVIKRSSYCFLWIYWIKYKGKWNKTYIGNNKMNSFLINFLVAVVGIYVLVRLFHSAWHKQKTSLIDRLFRHVSLYMTLAIDVVQTLRSFMAKTKKKKKRGEENGIDLFLRLVAVGCWRSPSSSSLVG